MNFNNINDVVKKIDEKYQQKCTKILIDSALGKNVGTIIINSGELCIGKGLNKNKKITGCHGGSKMAQYWIPRKKKIFPFVDAFIKLN